MLDEANAFVGERRFLSNFYPSPWIYLEGAPINVNGARLYQLRFWTVEHAFQAAKTLDVEVRGRIARLSTPGKAKRAGRKVELRPDWEDIKIEVMRNLLVQKFSIPHFAERLLLTGNDHLMEGNTWGDQFWGCVWSKAHEDWIGGNRLGEILMDIRDELREPYAKHL